ncbi:MAG: 16S rRNA (cytidine(1402)-2'-O)-methyltransferase [Campylobacterota bacterium]
MLTFVPTPIGNLQDITYRALDKFSSAHTILCEDTRVTKQLIALLSQTHDIDCNATFISFHHHNQHERLKELGTDFFDNDIVYVSDAGMPAISDPGALLVRYCRQNGIEYDVYPGASAAITAYAASGFEGSFVFYGFLPKEKREKALAQVLSSTQDIILYEAPHRIQKLLERIVQEDGDREIFLAKEISKKFQKYYHGRAKDIILQNSKGEWVVILRGRESDTLQLDRSQIMQLDMAPKPKSKLLAKLGKKTAKQWYNELINQNKER